MLHKNKLSGYRRLRSPMHALIYNVRRRQFDEIRSFGLNLHFDFALTERKVEIQKELLATALPTLSAGPPDRSPARHCDRTPRPTAARSPASPAWLRLGGTPA